MLHQKKVYKNEHVAFNIFIFFLAIYLLTSSGINMHQFEVGFLRLDVVKSVFERHDFTVPAGTGIVGFDGRNYSWFGIGPVLLSLPLYLIGKLAGVPPSSPVNLMNPLFASATAVLIFLFSTYLGYSRRSSIYVSIIYGLCTMAWYYAKDPGDHVLETFFVILSVYWMHRYVVEHKLKGILISGASLGVACLTRPTSFMVILPLSLMLLIGYMKENDCRVTVKYLFRDAAYFFMTLFPFVGISLWYNNYRFGSVFETGYSLTATRLGLDFFSGTPLVNGLVGLLLSPGKGYFYYTPAAILFFFVFRRFLRKHLGLAVCFITMIVLYVLFISRNIYWHGDWAWGPRYLFVLTPFFYNSDCGNF